MTNLSLKDRIERLGRVPGAPRVTSGSSATVELQPPDNLRDLQTIPAIESLVRRGGLSPRQGCNRGLVRQPPQPASVYVPTVEGHKEFAAEMAANGLQVRFVSTPPDEPV